VQGECVNTVYCQEDFSTFNSHKNLNKATLNLIGIVMLASVLLAGARRIFASEEAPNESGAMLLVLEDCDSDNKLSTEPYGDTASLLNSKSKVIRKFCDLTIKSTFGGARNVSVSPDGRRYLVCENEPAKLAVYETATRRELWSLRMDFRSAVFANGMIYAVNNYNVSAIDNTGTILRHAKFGGLDIAVDTKRGCLWIAGLDVKKCNLDLRLDFKAKLPLDPAHAGGLSVDVSPDGSIWAANGDVYKDHAGKSQLVKTSPDGNILKTIDLDFSPVRLRIDSSDGSVWTTGIRKERDFSGIGDEWPETVDELNELVKTKIETFTCKYDSDGNLIFETSDGGCSPCKTCGGPIENGVCAGCGRPSAERTCQEKEERS
jgi:hypothetical protein